MPPPKRERFHTESWPLIGEQVDRLIEERNLQSFWSIKHVLGPVIHILTIQVWGKWVKNAVTWIMDSQVSDIWNNVHIRIWTSSFKAARVGSIVLVSLVFSKTFQHLCYFHTFGVRDHLWFVWIAGCGKSKLRQNIDRMCYLSHHANDNTILKQQ